MLQKYIHQIVIIIGYVAVLLGVWEYTAKMINDSRLIPTLSYVVTVSLPSISLMMGAILPNTRDAVMLLGTQTAITLWHSVVGLVIGGIVGVFCGLVLPVISRWQSSQNLSLVVIRSIPVFALIPLFLFWFSGSSSAVYLYISFSVATIIGTNVYETVVKIQPMYAKRKQIFSLGWYRYVSSILFWAIQPQLAGSIRNTVGVVWALSLGAEFLAGQQGLGYLVFQSYMWADMGKLIVVSLVYSLLGILSFFFVNKWSQYTKRWMY